MSPRAYQVEMLEASLKQNIIVAMDTGSGKTQVAILRMREEVERSEKLVWFLAPTVSLATQQFQVIAASIADVQTRLLLGSDNVDKWAGPFVWKKVLTNVRIVVSTFQILFDALNHSMIPIGSLGLIVIDEAHNCAKKHPGARLMKEIYWPAKDAEATVPHILGLTASPLMRSNLKDIEVLEKTLDAVCRSPHRHREELIAHSNRPELHTVPYGPIHPVPTPNDFSPSMASLAKAYSELDMAKDPGVIRLTADKSSRGRDLLRKAILQKDTYIQKQMKIFSARSREAYQNIGSWAADYYIHRVISEFKLSIDATSNDSEESWADEEVKYLGDIFERIECAPATLDAFNLSRKVRELLNVLQSYQGDPVGIVFVKERYSVAILAYLISVHPLTKGRYRVAAMVGTSNMPGRKADFLDLGRRDDLYSLERFRNGSKNLLIATSVLEEGIDVPACNLVVCFDQPASLKSFIQRRGRARMQSSKLFLLVDDNSADAAAELQKLEQEMKQKYEDDMRELEELENIEDADAADYEVLVVESTGARMTIDDSKQNLDRFCSTLTSRKFVNPSPYYITQNADDESSPITKSSMIRATVFLPISLDIQFRKFESVRAWQSEKNACRDAAFQAYKKLYEAGLVNQHLIPMREEYMREGMKRVSMAMVREQMNPWLSVAQEWNEPKRLCRRTLSFTNNDGTTSEDFSIVLPVDIPFMNDMTLYWDLESSWTIAMDPDVQFSPSRAGILKKTPDHTPALFALAYGYRVPSDLEREKFLRNRSVLRFVSSSTNLTLESIEPRPFDMASFTKQVPPYLLRQIANKNHPYIFQEFLHSKPSPDLVKHSYRGFEEGPDDIPYIVVKNWPKKAGFFHPINPAHVPATTKPYPRVLPAEDLMVDSIPPVFCYFATMIPSITYALGVHLVATDLINNCLSSIGLEDLSLVLTAITASKARWVTNYEKLEFLGDALLKFCTTVHVSARFPRKPEGMLSQHKDGIISNARLYQACVESGLDQYILTNPLTLHKWRPIYVEDLVDSLDAPPDDRRTRSMSTKTLADVIEALIGAAFVSTFEDHPGGDVSRAVECMKLFLPREPWKHPDQDRMTLYNLSPADEALTEPMKSLEVLLGYEFQKKALLIEAMTHASYNRPDVRACLERLEFLGDAILDYIVVRKLFLAKDSSGQPLAHSDMHLLRTALVNGDFIGFLVLEWRMKQSRVDIVLPQNISSNTKTVDGQLYESEEEMALWRFLRHSSQEMGLLMDETAARHLEQRSELQAAIQRGQNYPWAMLARLRIPKFFSDIFESVLGAVWVDSGSLDVCEEVLRRAGIMWYLERMLRDGVHVLHPKEELGHAAGQEKVAYEDESRVAEDGSREFLCRIRVGERGIVAAVDGGVTKEEARTRAAMKALKVLRG
ncbi:P-loop containing nucleoside triphosphate hydrolase protein [Thozetella sp. PMI_491]|nr:P-loop containing nucleoside triphosphate hydrolase protein [Thozetella sp. PMI_491]